MCELFGISADKKVQVNDYLKAFFVRSCEHPHGWGMACMEGNGVSIEKEPMQASKSNYLKERLSIPVQVKTAFAHIRYATIGQVEYKNCHPYTMRDKSGRQWTLIHNGTIFEYEPLNPYVHIQNGNTDSERILLYVVDQVNKAERRVQRKLDRDERFYLLDSLVTKISKGNKLNLMMYDGEVFYVHTNYKKSLHQLEKDGQILFSTAPLSEEDWQPVTFTTLLGYEGSTRIFEGTNHGNEYVDSEENMKFLYSIFSSL